MAIATDSNLFVAIAGIVALSAFGLAGIVALLSVVHRIGSDRRDRRMEDVLMHWRASFAGNGESVRPLPLRRDDAFTVLTMWTSFRSGQMEGGRYSNARLDAVARAAGFYHLAERFARSNDDAHRIVGLRALGFLRATGCLYVVEAATNSRNAEISFAAYQALIAIDPTQIQRFFDALAQNRNWIAPNVEATMRSLGPAVVGVPFARSLLQAEPADVARLAQYIPLTEPSVARLLIPAAIARHGTDEVIAALLRSFRAVAQPADREFLLPYLKHESAFVRLAALSAFAPLAGVDDRPILLGMLSDPNHWIRDRAAQALLAQRDVAAYPALLDGNLTDAFARDAIAWVRAENTIRKNQPTSLKLVPPPLRFVNGRLRASE